MSGVLFIGLTMLATCSFFVLVPGVWAARKHRVKVAVAVFGWVGLVGLLVWSWPPGKGPVIEGRRVDSWVNDLRSPDAGDGSESQVAQRGRAYLVLERIGPAYPDAATVLVSHDRTERETRRVPDYPLDRALLRIGPPAEQALNDGLKDADDHRRLRAARLLVRINPGHEGARQVLREALTEDWSRDAAAAELARLGPAARECLPALRDALKQAPTSPAVAEALVSIGRPEEVASDLLAAIKASPELLSSDSHDRLEYLLTVCRLGPPLIRPLVEMLPEGGWALALALMAQEDKARCAVPILVRHLNAPPGPRVVSLEVLAAIGPEARDALPTLRANLKPPMSRADIEENAILAIARLGPEAREAFPELLAVASLRGLGDPPPLPSDRYDQIDLRRVGQALTRLVADHPTVYLPLLLAAIERTERRDSAAVLLSLVLRERPATVSDILSLLAHKDSTLRAHL